jgi:hypothetical protein
MYRRRKLAAMAAKPLFRARLRASFAYGEDRLLEVTGMHCARALANRGARLFLAYRPLRSPLDR